MKVHDDLLLESPLYATRPTFKLTSMPTAMPYLTSFKSATIAHIPLLLVLLMRQRGIVGCFH